MFDGAAIYTAGEAIDLLDEQQSSQTQSDTSQIISDVTSITDNPDSRKEIVFIDSGVDDYQTIVDAIDSSKSIYLIDSNENGFTKMQSILQSQQDVDAVHIIGHASAGQVVLGNSILNADTINSFSSTLQSIGSALTQNGDLLFYGCNLAQGEQGKLLLQQIGNITQADIAASDDITGKGGDWELEHNYGIVETKGIEVVDYDSFLLQTGISSLNGFVENTGTNLRAGTNTATTAASASNESDGKKPYVVTFERQVTTGSYSFYKTSSLSSGFEESNSGVQTSGPNINSGTTTYNASTDPMNSYYVYATENSGQNTVRSITFENEIRGVWFNMNNIVAFNNVSKDGATYHTQSEHGNGSNAYSTEKLKWTWGTNVTINSKPSWKHDWFGVDTDSNTLYIGFNNSVSHGDIIRVFTDAGGNAPVAQNDTGVVNEDATLTVSNNANRNLSGIYNVNGEHSGDVIDTNSTTNQDTDADGDTLTVTAVRLGSTEGSGSSGSLGSALTGTYGQLTLNSNGSYSYVANQAAADALDAGDTAYDYFNYTVSDGTQTDTAVITIIIKGINDDVVAVNDYGVVTENSSISITNGESQNLSGSYDAHDEHSGDISANDTDNDASPTHTITAIRTGSSEGLGTSGSLGSALDGTYGQLTLNANGSYTYAANKAAADVLDAGDTAYDYFNYTVSDGTDTDTGVIRISILGINDAPVAQNDEGVIVEAGTLTVANSANANVSGSYDATGEHTGDIIHTSSSSHQDTDADADANLTVTAVQVGRENSALRSSQFAATYNSLSMLGNIGAHDIEFNSDGTKMFVASYGRDTVREYALSTAFDLTTMSYTRELSLTTALSSNIQGLTFNNDGTKLFVIELYGGIAEYHLTTGYDLSTASYDSFKQLTMTAGYQDINFNDDGTKMYTISWGDDRIRQYTLSTGFDVSTASSSYSSFYMGSQDSLPNGMTFTNNGSRLFVAGDNSNSLIEYSLSTAYDITTATHVGTTSVASQTTAPESIAFNNAGTKMYVIEKVNHNVLEYDIATPFRLSFETGTVGTILRGTYGSLTLNSNGSYTYVADSSIVGLDANESVIDYFNYTVSDGTATDTAELKITVLGAGNTAPVARNDVGVIAEDSTLTVSNGANANESGGSYNATGEHSGDVLNTSSTTHYDTDADGDTLTVASVRTGSDEGNGTAGTLGQALTGTYGQLTLNTNGSYTYVANHTAADALDLNDSVTDVFNYTVSDGNGGTDIATITITILGINDAPVAQDDEGVILEGSTLTVANSANANVSGSFDATGEHSGDVIDTSSSSHTDSDADASASLSITHVRLSGGSNSTVASSSSYNSNGTSITGTYGTLTIGADGSYTYAATTDATNALDSGESATDTFVYTLSDGTAITTANLTITVLGANDAPVAQNDTGTVNEDATLTVSDGDGTSTVAGASYVDSINLYILSGYQGGYPQDIKFNNDGTKMFVVEDNANAIREYHLTTGFDISTASYDSLFSVHSQDTNPRGLAFNNDGTKMFVAGWSNQRVFEYHLTTGFDISTASYDSNLSISSNAGGSNGLAFNSDGTKMFVNCANSSDEVVEYTLSTGFDVSTASYDSSFVTQSQDTSPQGLAFSNDGKKMFVAGDTGDDINEYTLSTGFDVSTASFVGSFDVSSQGTQPTGITFNNDGTKMFITDQSGSLGTHSVEEYTLTTPFSLVDVSGEHTGDVIDSSNTSTRDTDVDVETLTVTAVRLGSSEGSGTAGTVGSALTGTYGQLTLNSNGSYTYVANQTAADDLDAGDVVTDSFNYTVSDGTTTDIAVITITVIGINDAPSAQNDVGVIVEDGTLTVANGANATLTGSYDATGENSGDLMDTSSSSHKDSDVDDSASLSITQIKKNGGSNSAVASGSSYNSSGTQVTGTYGTLTIGADGSYTYVADQAAADPLDTGETATDVFVYTLSDGTATTTATLTITILGANDAPVARNDVGVIEEDSTLTVSDGDNANVTSTYDATGEHSGDVIHTSSTTHQDTDIDVETLTVTAVRKGSVEGSGDAGTVGQALTGIYGQLTLNANGSYTYAANQTAADALDAGDSVTDTFNYTVSDGTATDIGTITITVLGINDDPVAQNDVGVIVEDGTLTVANGANATLTGSYDATGENSGDLIDTSSSSHTDSDADASASLSITQIKKDGGSNSSVSSGSSYNSSGTSVTGTYGTLTIGADGSYTYAATQDAADALDVGDTATDVFVYTLSDGTATTTATLTITILGANDAPVAANDYGAINENATLTVADGDNQYFTANQRYDDTGEHSGDVINTTYTGTDTDVDGDTLTVSAVRLGSTEGSGTAGTVGQALTGTYGQLTLNANGSYTYVANQAAAEALDAGDSETDSFNYTVTDGALTDTALIQIIVFGVNDTPVAQNDVGVILEDSTLTVANGDNANETNDSGSTFNATGEHSGDVIDTSSSSHTDSDADASASLSITQIKKNGGSNSSVASSSSYNSNGTSVTGTYGTLTIGADGSYTYAATADAADGVADGESVTDVFVYTLSDGTETTTATITITILGANDNPTAQNDVGVIMEGDTLTVANSANANVSGSFDATGEHSGDVIDTSSSSHTDNDPDTSDTLTITHIKKDGGSNSTVSSGSSYNSSGTAVTGAYGTLTIGADGSYKYVAQSDIAGFDAGETLTDTFTYTVSDGTASTTANLVITLLGDDGSSNNAPVAQNDVGVIVEDGTLTVANGANANETNDSGTTFNATGEHSGDVMNTSSSSHSDSDADSDAITVTLIRKSGGSDSAITSGSSYNSSGTSVTGTYGTLTIGADGSYTYVADQSAADDLDLNDSVTDTFIYTISDGTATDTATLTITVLGINDTPTAVDDTDTVDEDGTVTKTGSQDDVLTDDSDPDDSATLTVTAIQPSGGSSSNVTSGTTYTNGTSVTGTYGTLVIGADGSYTYSADQSAADDLDAGDSVTDVFTYTVTDENGATTTATITITVNGINDTPVAQNDVGVIVEDGTLTVANGDNANESGGSYNATGEHSGDVIDTSSSSHTDSDADDSASLSITQIKKDGGSDSAVSSGSSYNSNGTSVTGTYGTLTIGADGSYTYVADQTAADALDSGDSVTDVFVYTLSDGTATTTANITITVLGINDPPVAVDDTDTVDEDGTVTKTGSQDDVLTDDSDPDDSGTLTVTAIQPSGGSSSNVTSGTTYTDGTQSTGTYGTLTIGADGSYTYTADQDAADALDAGDTVTDVFTYTVTDENGETTTATITITVNGVNDIPVAQNDHGVIVEDGTLTVANGVNANVTGTYNVTGEHSGDVIDTSHSSHTDSDADASASLSITQIKKNGGSNSSVSSGSSYNSSGTSVTGTYGTLTIGADGSYTYVADQDAADALNVNSLADDVFVYTLSDGTATTTATLTITVLGANDDPVAVNDTDTVSAGATVTKTGSQDDVLTDDSDPDNSATLTVTAIQPSGGSSSDVTSSSTYASNGTTVVGTYGTLIIGADGSYTYTADQSAADALDAGETADDVFTYTVTDENGATTTATLTITVGGSNDAPVARDDTGTVKEDATLTVSDGDNANAVSAATYVDGFSISDQESAPQGFRFNNDGTKMFVVGSNGDDVNEYTLSTGFDVSTASFVDSFDISSQEEGARDVAFSDNGLKMFVVGVRGDDVNEYTLSTAFDVSTASFVDSFDISSQDDSPTGLAFNNDGTKMFVAGNAGNDINEYTLSTGFDVSTAAFVDSFSVASQDTTPNGLSFNGDGTKMYVVGNQGNDINEYDLTLGFDVSTASFVGALDVSGQDSAPKAVNFNNDGTKVFVLGTANKQVFEYTLDTPFSLINVNDEHSGDVIDTSNTSSQDTDADGDTLTVASVRTGNSEGAGTAGTVGSALTGTYGELTLNANGSYTYVANQSAADDLDAGDVVYDYFNYTVSDGNGGTDIAVITITVIGINDTPVAVNDTDSVVEDGSVTKTGSEDDVLYDDTDVDDSHALTVTAITPSGGSTSTVTEGSTHSSGGTTVTGTYGTLVIGADGSYTYTADQDAADALDNGDTATDVFTYTVSDGTNTTTATITITVTGINDNPVAQDDVGVIEEDGTLTVANSANANVTDSYDATGEHSGDVIDTTSTTHTDNDADDSASLTVTAVRLGSTEDAGSAGTVGEALTGTYGQLTLNANGSYTYVANQDFF